MLGSITLLFFCIFFFAEGIVDLVFPLDNYQFQFLNWIDCETKEQIKLVDVDGKQQLRLQKGKGICLDLNNQLLLDEDQTYNYNFIFDRYLNQDEIYIFINYKMYNLSNKITAQPFIQIQHYHFLTCQNQIEIWLNSNVSINLFFVYIAKVYTNTQDQVLLTGQIPQVDNYNKFYYDFRFSLEQEIKNGTLYYQAIVPKSQYQQSQFYWFQLYLNNSLLPLQISQLDSNNSLINGSQNIFVDHHQKLNNLDFMIKTKYQIRQMFLISEYYQSLDLEAITQIDDNFSQLTEENILYKTEFKSIDQVRMLVEVQQIIKNNIASIQVLPKQYYKDISNFQISFAKIKIQNEKQQTFLECYFIEDDQNDSCLGYNSTLFQFEVKWIFENNIQYSYELSGTLKKNIQTDPFIFFQTDTQYFPIINIDLENNKEFWIGYFLLLHLVLPIFIYLFCVFCILSLKAYHPYMLYIIETDNLCFQFESEQQQSMRFQTTQQQQQSEEAGRLNQSNINVI
ncbi:unnamed protein product [Paramecium primaurelia]|uniref:Transmembrane protein n=1 Tax=Paramecium primaurelia TaxID=5886 RepID=A0A8S1JPL4_PARPR|nr:unnamed protein product [Paramecium primaurelia]